MTGAVIGGNFAVIGGFLGGIPNQQGNGCPGSFPFKDTGEDLHLVSLFTGSGDGTLAGLAAVKVNLDIPFAKQQPGGAAVNDRP